MMNLSLIANGTATGWIESLWPYLNVAWYATFVLALFSIPSVLIKRRGRPQAALSWVLILFTVPIAGLFFWWAIGRTHLVRKRRKRRRTDAAVSEQVARAQEETAQITETKWDLVPIEHLSANDKEWAFPPTRCNSTKLLIDADQTYPEIERLIREAKSFLHIIFYIWQTDDIGRKFRDLLVEKAKAGVEVRLLLDAFGASPAGGRFMKPLRDAGGKVETFGPAILRRWHLEFNFRNHRKLVIADGREAILGGLNIGQEYTEHWHDLALLVSGPVMDQLQEVFIEDWVFAGGKAFAESRYFGRWQAIKDEESGACSPSLCAVVASGPHSDVNLTHEAFLLAITQAKERVWLTTPYFIPDQTIVAALRTAVFRGIDVRVLVPEEPDAWLVGLASRSYYPFLLKSGVRIFEYCNGILHAKAAVIDQDVAFVGSANMDVRSFKLNFELSCFLQCVPLCTELAALFEEDLTCAREVTKEDVEGRNYWSQVGEAAAHLLSPLL